jgi:hypothetical protein
MELIPTEIWALIFSFTEANDIILDARISKFFLSLLRSDTKILKETLCQDLCCCTFYSNISDCKKTTIEIIKEIKKESNITKTCKKFITENVRPTWLRDLYEKDPLMKHCLYSRHVYGLVSQARYGIVNGISISSHDRLFVCSILSGFILCVANANVTIVLDKAILTCELDTNNNKSLVVDSHGFGPETVQQLWDIIKIIFESEIVHNSFEKYNNSELLFKNGSRISSVYGSSSHIQYHYLYGLENYNSGAITPINPLWFLVKFNSEDFFDMIKKKRYADGSCKDTRTFPRPDNIFDKNEKLNFDFNISKIKRSLNNGTLIYGETPSHCLTNIHTFLEVINNTPVVIKPKGL